jgi:hypothetical protein
MPVPTPSLARSSRPQLRIGRPQSGLGTSSAPNLRVRAFPRPSIGVHGSERGLQHRRVMRPRSDRRRPRASRRRSSLLTGAPESAQGTPLIQMSGHAADEGDSSAKAGAERISSVPADVPRRCVSPEKPGSLTEPGPKLPYTSSQSSAQKRPQRSAVLIADLGGNGLNIQAASMDERLRALHA